jgi:hypothetical protein
MAATEWQVAAQPAGAEVLGEGRHAAFDIGHLLHGRACHGRLYRLDMQRRRSRAAEYTDQPAQRLRAIAQACFDLDRAAAFAQALRTDRHVAGRHRRNEGGLQAAQWHVEGRLFAHRTQSERRLQSAERAASLQPVRADRGLPVIAMARDRLHRFGKSHRSPCMDRVALDDASATGRMRACLYSTP